MISLMNALYSGIRPRYLSSVWGPSWQYIRDFRLQFYKQLAVCGLSVKVVLLNNNAIG